MTEEERKRLAAGLMGAMPNQFGPLTPEQQAMIQRDKIDEAMGPFDWGPGLITAAGAGIGAMAIPAIAKGWGDYLRRYGTQKGLGYAAQEGGMLVGVPAALGYATDLKWRADDRHKRELELMFPDQRDAESQPGGFYGVKR